MTELNPEQIGKKVGLPKKDIARALQKPSNSLNYIKRRIRYFCFAKQRGDWAPVKLVRHMEAQDLFTGWENFAVNWDVDIKNPLNVYYRMFSIHEEWEAELRRVVPDLPIDPSYTQSQ